MKFALQSSIKRFKTRCGIVHGFRRRMNTWLVMIPLEHRTTLHHRTITFRWSTRCMIHNNMSRRRILPSIASLNFSIRVECPIKRESIKKRSRRILARLLGHMLFTPTLTPTFQLWIHCIFSLLLRQGFRSLQYSIQHSIQCRILARRYLESRLPKLVLIKQQAWAK